MATNPHVEIRTRIETMLRGRTWRWLAQASGVPPSTLSNQLARPKFTIDVLYRLAEALECQAIDLLPCHGDSEYPVYVHGSEYGNSNTH